MKKLLALLAVLAFATSAAAYTDAELQQFKKEYNNQTGQVPGFVSSVVGGETVNVQVEKESGTEVVGAEMEGLEIDVIRKGGFDSPTVKVNVSQDAIDAVKSTDAPYHQVRQELDEDGISYRSTTFGGQVKLTLFNALSGLAGMLGF